MTSRKILPKSIAISRSLPEDLDESVADISVINSPKSPSLSEYMNLIQSPGTSPSRKCSDQCGGRKCDAKGRECHEIDDELLLLVEDNRKREQEMWAMLAGQAAFKFDSYIFHQVLPESFIKPHIFPRHVKDMQSLIEKYTARGEEERLEGAAEKWKQLKNKWHWNRHHAIVLATVKSAYLHISKPLEVMMRLDKEKADTLKGARRAFRNSLPPKLHSAGDNIVDFMHSAGLLTDKSKEDSSDSDEKLQTENQAGVRNKAESRDAKDQAEGSAKGSKK